jgi:hypothetical protein
VFLYVCVCVCVAAVQLERKRHIGNDIVIIVWQDGDTVYRPTTISSRQVHVAFVIKAVAVEEDPNETYYRYPPPPPSPIVPGRRLHAPLCKVHSTSLR